MKIFFFIISIFLFLLYPTSVDGIIRNSLINVSIDWLILISFLILIIYKFGKTDRTNGRIAISVFIYLFIISIISNIGDYRGSISVARIAPISMFLILSSFKINFKIPIKTSLFIFDLTIILITVVNILIVIQDQFTMDFIVNNYSQLYDSATSNMFIKSRPVFTFGVYTFASYFYTLFFILCTYSYRVTKKYKYLIYCFIFLLFNILLVSNTTIISSIFMSIVLLFFTFKKSKYRGVNIFFIIITLFLVAYFMLGNIEILGYFLESFSSANNGYLGRYSSGGVLKVINDYLIEYPNIGFNIIRDGNLVYTDSGYYVLRLMGGWIILIPFYVLLYRYMKMNLGNQYRLFFIFTMIFEFALPVILYIKYIHAMIFISLYLKSFDHNTA